VNTNYSEVCADKRAWEKRAFHNRVRIFFFLFSFGNFSSMCTFKIYSWWGKHQHNEYTRLALIAGTETTFFSLNSHPTSHYTCLHFFVLFLTTKWVWDFNFRPQSVQFMVERDIIYYGEEKNSTDAYYNVNSPLWTRVGFTYRIYLNLTFLWHLHVTFRNLL
jgi:hypothetical protein